MFDASLQGDVLRDVLGKDIVMALFTSKFNIRLKKYGWCLFVCRVVPLDRGVCVCHLVYSLLGCLVVHVRHTRSLSHTRGNTHRLSTDGAFNTIADLLSHLPKEYPQYKPPPEGGREVLHGACIAVTGTVIKSAVFPFPSKVWLCSVHQCGCMVSSKQPQIRCKCVRGCDADGAATHHVPPTHSPTRLDDARALPVLYLQWRCLRTKARALPQGSYSSAWRY